jgi:hypothetical protein
MSGCPDCGTPDGLWCPPWCLYTKVGGDDADA